MEENPEEKIEKQEELKSQIQEDAKGLVQRIKDFLSDLLDIREDTNKEATIENIKASISMQGHTAWVLIFSIIIASVGLNTSSTAVVIGAMLISPLMGPILGIGLSLAINDIDMMRKSLINFGVMVGLSILTSFLFFSIPVFQQETPELIARTFPDFRDVFIALSGGFALIVALSRKSQQINTIAGVAIATALMPPLCTAGYGLATGKWNFFGGAFFLFSINIIFIALATYLVVRFLKFPHVKYLVNKKRKLISRAIYIVATLIIIPSIYMFYQLYIKTDFENTVNEYITDLKENQGVGVVSSTIKYEDKILEIHVLGKKISDKQISKWESDLKKKGVNISIEIPKDEERIQIAQKVKIIEQQFSDMQTIISSKEQIILNKENKIIQLETDLKKFIKDKIPFNSIVEEIKINYPSLNSLSYSNMLKYDFIKKRTDTIPTFFVGWSDNPNSQNLNIQKQNFKKWIKKRIEKTKVQIIEE